MSVPELRIATGNRAPIRPERATVLYWMTAARRTRWSFALQHAVDAAVRLGKRLLVLEGLRCDYPHASDRLHRFVMDGMADNAARFSKAGVAYLPYVEPSVGAGRGLLAALAADAALIVTDDYPCFVLPRMAAAAAARVDVRLEAVDGSGLLPMRAADQPYPTAYAFRRHLQRTLAEHLAHPPAPDPIDHPDLRRDPSIPAEIAGRWRSASGGLGALPIDHRVGPVDGRRGGEVAAERALTSFVDRKLARYADERNEPASDGTSGLSPYLHFGHLSIHHLLAAVASREAWSAADLASTAAGQRTGWWGMSASAEAFLDQAVTWRELGLNFCAHRTDYDRFDSLPPWALRTLAQHASDPRPHLYELDELAAARTHDPIWNAAQTQLVREGRIHNYLRMLWGKKILEWTRTPEEAAEAMIALNDRFALDGRDPNSYSGIFWVLGRYDRPWGPERAVFGTVRVMTSASAARKFDLSAYLARHGTARALL
jgi:deoxyribodipyrimidine photo-lyase